MLWWFPPLTRVEELRAPLALTKTFEIISLVYAQMGVQGKVDYNVVKMKLVDIS